MEHLRISFLKLISESMGLNYENYFKIYSISLNIKGTLTAARISFNKFVSRSILFWNGASDFISSFKMLNLSSLYKVRMALSKER